MLQYNPRQSKICFLVNKTYESNIMDTSAINCNVFNMYVTNFKLIL